MKFRVNKILKNTSVEGPGKRYCIWFQGCSKRCRGCFNRTALDFDGGIEEDTDKIIKDIFNTRNIEGVTFLGGEPFEQFEPMYKIAYAVHKKGLSVLCFTGMNFEFIKEKYSKILPCIDILIDGEFDENKLDYSRPWVGSSNQNYYFLSKRYDESILKQYKNKAEININKKGEIFINGMGDFKKLAKQLQIYTTDVKNDIILGKG